jgi:hypothetical protein
MYPLRLSCTKRVEAVYGRRLAYFPCMTKHIITSTITAVALASVCACNRDNRDNRNNMPSNQTPMTQRAPSADQQAVNSPITVTGCLQKEGGFTTTYIVTAMNEPSQNGIGTSGNGAAVDREQLREAQNAYRVSPRDNVDMESMVGKQVRVTGVIAKRADLPSATTGNDQARDMQKIDKGDLAKIDNATVSVVSDTCGHDVQPSSTPNGGK